MLHYRDMKDHPRALARKSGSKTFEGIPCKKCGGTTRRTVSGNCSACLSKQVINWRIESGWNERTVGQRRETDRIWVKNNPHKVKATRDRYLKKLRLRKKIQAIIAQEKPLA